jgi:3-deoxy-D-manno-octulosonic-acid transferase
VTLLLDLFWIAAAVLGAPLLAWKLATKARWRVGLLERLGIRLPPPGGGRPVIWVHAVSVGEVHAARPLIREIERALPDHEVVISTVTSTGLEVARRHMPGNRSFFYPLDISFAVRRLLRAVRPRMVVLVELELWPTFLATARAAGIPVVVANGRISERSARHYRFVRRLITRPITRFCVQNEEYAQRFLGLGVAPERVLITGNLKYDTPALEAEGDAAAAARALRARLGIAEGAPVIVAGSTHPSEERTCALAWTSLRKRFPGLRLVVAPRHLERLAALERDLAEAGVATVRKTVLDARASAGEAAAAPGSGSAGAGTAPEPPVVILDTMGELSRLYLVADVVFVGGSLIPHGGQNMLEPAALGKPTVFGPHVRNFQAIARDLLAAGGAEQVADAAALAPALERILADGARAASMGASAQAFVARHRGAARRTVEVLVEAIGAPSGGAARRAAPEPGRVAGNGCCVEVGDPAAAHR